jgi:hypothetical protein
LFKKKGSVGQENRDLIAGRVVECSNVAFPTDIVLKTLFLTEKKVLLDSCCDVFLLFNLQNFVLLSVKNLSGCPQPVVYFCAVIENYTHVFTAT